MLIANQTSRSTAVSLEYRRRHDADPARIDRVPITVQVDDGPKIIDRARKVLALQCCVWMAQDYSWRYWIE